MVNDRYFSFNDKQVDLLYSSRWYVTPSSLSFTSKQQNFFKTLLQKFERTILTEKRINLDFSFDFKFHFNFKLLFIHPIMLINNHPQSQTNS